MKQCIRCGKEDELSSFPKDKTKKDGRKPYCFECNRSIINKSAKKNKSKRKLYNIKNRESISEYNKQYYSANKDKFQTNYQKYLNSNPSFKIAHNTRVRINKALKLNLKKSSTFDLLGCDINSYREYLESMFTKDMTWDNYGSYWDIDHIIPCAQFDLESLEEQKKCFHYTNTQPLDKKTNQQKNQY